jgi:K+-sensing histidine kinase KdpD
MHPSRRRNRTLFTRILDLLASDPGIVVVTLLTIICIYFIDTITPLGEPVWLLYLIPLVLSYWSSRLYAIPAVTLVTLFFLIGGFLLSPEGIPVTQAILNRFTFFLTFICAAIILWIIRRRQITGNTIF